MNAFFRWFALVFCVALQAPDARTQDPRRGLHVTPWVGAFWSHAPGGVLPVVDDVGVVEARMTGSPALGVDVEADLPVRSLRVRGGLGLAVLSAVEFLNWDGALTRGNTHFAFGNPQGVGSSVLLLSGSAVFSPLEGSPTVYGVGGVGVKRYVYSNMAGELEEVLSGDRTSLSVQIGLGVAIRDRWRLEISDHIGRHSFAFAVPALERRSEPARTYHDLILTLGYRFGH